MRSIRFDFGRDPFADCDRAILVKCAVIAKARDIKFQRFRFEQPWLGTRSDDEMRKIGWPVTGQSEVNSGAVKRTR